MEILSFFLFWGLLGSGIGLAFCLVAFIIIIIANFVFKKLDCFKAKGMKLKVSDIRWVAPALSFIAVIVTGFVVRPHGLEVLIFALIYLLTLIFTPIFAAIIGGMIKKREGLNETDINKS